MGNGVTVVWGRRRRPIFRILLIFVPYVYRGYKLRLRVKFWVGEGRFRKKKGKNRVKNHGFLGGTNFEGPVWAVEISWEPKNRLKGPKLNIF